MQYWVRLFGEEEYILQTSGRQELPLEGYREEQDPAPFYLQRHLNKLGELSTQTRELYGADLDDAAN